MPSDAEAEPGLRLGALVGERRRHHVAAVGAAAAQDPGRRGDGVLGPPVGVVGVVHADPRVGGEGELLQLERQFDLAFVRVAGQLVAPQRLLGDGDTVGLGQPGPLVDGPEVDVVAGLGDDLVERRLVERAGVGEAGAAVADHPDADAGAVGGDVLLDAALVDAHLRLAATRDVGLDLLAGMGPVDDPGGDRLQIASGRSRRAVPPIGQRLAPAASGSRRRPARPGRPCRTCPGDPWRSRRRSCRCRAAPAGRCR